MARPTVFSFPPFDHGGHWTHSLTDRLSLTMYQLILPPHEFKNLTRASPATDRHNLLPRLEITFCLMRIGNCSVSTTKSERRKWEMEMSGEDDTECRNAQSLSSHSAR